jgi:hypothetical protein
LRSWSRSPVVESDDNPDSYNKEGKAPDEAALELSESG